MKIKQVLLLLTALMMAAFSAGQDVPLEEDSATPSHAHETSQGHAHETASGDAHETSQGHAHETAQGHAHTHETAKGHAHTHETASGDAAHKAVGVVVLCLGGGEDLVAMAQIVAVLHGHGHKVTAVLYGPEPRDHPLPDGVEVLEIPLAEDDPLYPGGVAVGVTPEEEDEGVVSGRVLASRARACGRASRLPWVEHALSRAQLMVTPLFLHDVYALALAARAGVPCVGVVTSRAGAWWAWEHLGVLPPLATTPVPPSTMGQPTLWARASNLARHYGYLSTLRQKWQAPALTALDPSWRPWPLEDLYDSLAAVLVTWDPLLDRSVPAVPSVVPVGGLHLQKGIITKDVLVPAILNRAGLVVVCAGGGEAWVGAHALNALYRVLRSTPYTVLWRDTYPHLRPVAAEGANETARFLFRRVLPLGDVLDHPRHRLLVSTCGETEVMSAVYYGSPVLCLPVTTDQTMASAALAKLGLAEVVPAAEATEDTLRMAFGKLTTNRRYREKGRELGEELHDQALAPSDRLLYTLERIMRRPHSRRYLRGARGSAGLYLLQMSNADVYLILLILLATLIGILICLAITLMPILLRKEKAKKE